MTPNSDTSGGGREVAAPPACDFWSIQNQKPPLPLRHPTISEWKSGQVRGGSGQFWGWRFNQGLKDFRLHAEE